MKKLRYNSPQKEIIDVINALVEGYTFRCLFEKYKSAPSNPQEGMVVWADGTNWNPGSGAGLYEYRGGSWQKL